jgi:hypothetical protein
MQWKDILDIGYLPMPHEFKSDAECEVARADYWLQKSQYFARFPHSQEMAKSYARASLRSLEWAGRITSN